MKLTTRGRYAVQALIDLINHSNGKAVKLQDISDRQKLSISYLEQLFRQLRIAGIVKSVRGPGGGYVLANTPDQTKILDVLKAVKELAYYTDVLKLSPEASKEEVSAYKLIQSLDLQAENALQRSLATLV
jgi:Rrf2 family iron-sulfur cluster assembly transcriptional regulator